ncbi:MAG: tetratricopeptide repeat protein [Desulfobacteraceae bacterium]|nr:tetratricopeptide repeat protein [Desulfobacteraceae bacterium]
MALYDPLIENHQQNKYEEQYNRNHSSSIGRLQPGVGNFAPQAYVDEPGCFKNNNNPFLKLKPFDRNRVAKDAKATRDQFFQAVQNGRNHIMLQSLNVEGIGIDVNNIGRNGKTPLQTAVDNRHFDVAVTLINEGARGSDQVIKNLFLKAAQNGRNDIVEFLKDKEGVKFDALKFADKCYKKGETMIESGDYKGARKYSDMATGLNPKHFNAQFNLGVASHKLGGNAGAKIAFKKATELNPKHLNAHYNLGLVSYELGEYDCAKKAYKKATKLNPNDPDAQFGLGNAKSKLRDFPGAKQSFKEATKLKPYNADAHIGLGNAKYELGDFAGAKKAYETAIQLKPDNAYAHIGLGNAKSKLRDFPGARAAYDTAEKLKSNM